MISHYILWAVNGFQYQGIGSFRDRKSLDDLKKTASLIRLIPSCSYKIMAVHEDGSDEFIGEENVRRERQ